LIFIGKISSNDDITIRCWSLRTNMGGILIIGHGDDGSW
jgi:hypothetical protein